MKYISNSTTVTTRSGVEVSYLANVDQFAFRTKKDKALRSKEDNDCVVVALAHALGISYSKAHAFCKEYFNRKDKEGVFYFHRILFTNKQKYKEIAEKYLGNKKLKAVNATTVYRNRCEWYGTMKEVQRKMTLKTFLKTYPKGRYVLAFSDHAIAVIDGVVVGNGEIGDAIRVRRPIEIAVEVECLI